MPGTVITDLRRRGAVDPGRLLAGPLRGVGLQRLEPGHRTEVAADGVEHALYVTAGSGLAEPPENAVRPDAAANDDQPYDPEPQDSGIPLVEATAVVLPLGSRTVLTAGTAGMEYFHAVLTVPAGRPIPPSGDEPA
ncbi:hypothetical protein [Streptomyces sp. 1331.2]|uniref:hypothetical protein n=1 Tax=Streptomyces sp. 1331.2 TaxID=1938835 RepID=UPI000BCF0AD7|nr:hypothetical protein [Streptomyces sp. 1331.2]SOB80898.1 hypothetical protein SAMN06272789_1181 [Streptomyces sp. 1331.2]